MKIGIIATDGGEHSPEKMATSCVSHIMSFDPATLDGVRLLLAQRLELDLVDALVSHHAAARDDTRGELTADAAKHFARTDLHDPGKYLDQAVADVQAAADKTEWGPLFREPDKVAQIRHAIGQHLVDTMHLERLYHGDRNPNDLAAFAYRQAPTGTAVVPLSGEG